VVSVGHGDRWLRRVPCRSAALVEVTGSGGSSGRRRVDLEWWWRATDAKVAGRQPGRRMGRRWGIQGQAAVAALGGSHLGQVRLRPFLQVQAGRGLGVPRRRHHHQLQRGDGRVCLVWHVGRV